MVSEGYTSAPFGDNSASPSTAEYTRLQKAFSIKQSNLPEFDSSQVNQVSLVNGSGSEGGSKKPAENGFMT